MINSHRTLLNFRYYDTSHNKIRQLSSIRWMYHLCTRTMMKSRTLWLIPNADHHYRTRTNVLTNMQKDQKQLYRQIYRCSPYVIWSSNRRYTVTTYSRSAFTRTSLSSSSSRQEGIVQEDSRHSNHKSLTNNTSNFPIEDNDSHGGLQIDEENTKNGDDDIVIKTKTMEWLKRIVIGLNLCPFAYHPYKNQLLNIRIVRGNDVENVILPYMIQALFHQAQTVGTTLVVCPDLYPQDFNEYWNIAQYLEHDIINEIYQEELQGIVQLAPFHPLFTFDCIHDNLDDEHFDEHDESIHSTDQDVIDGVISDGNYQTNTSTAPDVNDPSDYTNRSPYPIFHILREDDVAKAVTKLDGDASRVWSRNVDLLRELYHQLGTYDFHHYMTSSSPSTTKRASSRSSRSINPANHSVPTKEEYQLEDEATPTVRFSQQQRQKQQQDRIQAIVRSTLRDFRNKTHYQE